MTGARCRVKGCATYRKKGVSLFRVPCVVKNQGENVEQISYKRRQQWLKNLEITNLDPQENCSVCWKHFHSGKPAYIMDTLNPDWAPTKDMGSAKIKINPDRYKRRMERAAKKKLQECNKLTTTNSTSTTAIYSENPSNNSVAAVTSPSTLSTQKEKNAVQVSKAQVVTVVNKTGIQLSDALPALFCETVLQKEQSCAEKNCDNVIEFLRKQNAKLIRENKYLKKRIEELQANKALPAQGICNFDVES